MQQPLLKWIYLYFPIDFLLVLHISSKLRLRMNYIQIIQTQQSVFAFNKKPNTLLKDFH